VVAHRPVRLLVAGGVEVDDHVRQPVDAVEELVAHLLAERVRP
jgi:hypothetical protein